MSDDASFADGAPPQLALRAEGPDDLTVISALVQDAVIGAADIRWEARARRLTALMQRFRWEDADAARAEGRPFERVTSVLVLSDVLALRSDGIPQGEADTILELLALVWTPGADGTGRVDLTFAGDGTLAAEVECIAVELRDVTEPHEAAAQRLPAHDDA